MVLVLHAANGVEGEKLRTRSIDFVRSVMRIAHWDDSGLFDDSDGTKTSLMMIWHDEIFSAYYHVL